MDSTASRTASAHAIVGVVVALAALFEAGYGGRGAALTPVAVAGALVTGLAVAASRWYPLGAVLLLSATMVGAQALSTTGLPRVGGAQLIAYVLLVGNAAYRLPRLAGLLAYAVAATVPPLVIVVEGESVWEFVFFALILAPAWAVGFLLHREHARSAELRALAAELRAEREKQAEVAVAEERTRISRELHDAVAHTVSVMTLQVGVVRRRQVAGSVEEETLLRAEGLGRQAVDELRRIVGIVRRGESAALAPLPSLELLPALVEEVRRAGATVTLEVTGDADGVPRAVGMSAYRIAQEGLTNALRHASGAPVQVRVRVGDQEVEVTVENAAGGTRSDSGAGVGGHGLAGLRERVAVLGGALDAGAVPGGGHRLVATLPTGPVVAP
ncbi:signal transduction histidine kinase [Nocardioides cavernae]|uniref:histidine kinase n=1 Tax=Nocardioides cavernae TaxID=1921566 RepID=A0A7Y9H4D8_9ACTN|nr:histidine kinase [Nocardioides cavernae]NYE36999.1 signal transduction histidine kinase [Nocardioides cavernae]